ncbi:unnamed protein product [Dimorphilus gyrociliatus]|uniref:Sodium/calcium exchanger membrane region domain-containing protein n=1 Tax=Dimorphilus gyrociliatus TaxID=2664684 RepID=A0A7I8W8J9_9ANNE|nr:unnamed protein product [Dimorphilus gyrociliatus]
MSKETFYTNYSRGYIVEFVEAGDEHCSSWLLLPAENLWHEGVRGFLYIVALIYLFLGIAIASDVFMCSIESITAKKKTIKKYDEEEGKVKEVEVFVWNETVANLTLMAFGSSAPEILLAIGETAQKLGKEDEGDGLGTFTIIGSAAFNLLIITAICILVVDGGEPKKIKELGVFLLTSVWSIFAYIWMLIVVRFSTPGVIDMWEAWVTFAFFPLMVLTAYAMDNGFWIYKCHKSSVDVERTQSVCFNFLFLLL